MAIIIDGKELSKKIRNELKNEVIKLKEKNANPKLAVILVGDDPASQIYVRNKSKACENVGIEFEEFLFDSNIEEAELLETIEKLNNDKTISGILLQAPIPKHLNINKAFCFIFHNYITLSCFDDTPRETYDNIPEKHE